MARASAGPRERVTDHDLAESRLSRSVGGDLDAQQLCAAVDGALWIAVLPTKTTDKNKLGGALLNIGFVPDEEVAGIADVDPCPGEGPSDSGPEMVWQVSTPVVVQGTPRFLPLTLEGDTTRGLSQQGVVRLRLPLDPLALFADVLEWKLGK